jgi:D-alanyl-D-alanine carboxypeptidase
MKSKFILSLAFFCLNAMADESYILYDVNKNSVISEKNTNESHSIASLSKLMTAMVVLDNDPDMSKYGKNILQRLLIRSDNSAAEVLAKYYTGGRSAFISDMNKKARSLGLTQTAFNDPSGLSVFNRSTAQEYVRIVLEAQKYPVIREISSTYETKLSKHKAIHNTNALLKEYDNIVVSKTGFTNKAGRCLAMMLEDDMKKYVIVILGQPSVQSRTKLAKELISMTN